MLDELLSGQHSPEERQLRYKLRFLWKNHGYSAATPIVNLLLHDNNRDGVLWGMRFMLDTIQAPSYPASTGRASEILESDLSIEEQFRMLYFLLEEHHDKLTSNFITVFLEKLYRTDIIPVDLIPLYVKAGERLIAIGLVSLGRDLLEFLPDRSSTEGADETYSEMLSMVGDIRENPLSEFRAVYQMMLKRFNIRMSAETAEEVHEIWHIPIMNAWGRLQSGSPESRYQFMTREERIDYLDRLAEQTKHGVALPDENAFKEILYRMAVLDMEWRTEMFGLDDDPELSSEDESTSTQLPEFDNEDYLRCVDFVLEHFDHYLPDEKPENKAFVPLLYLPIFATGYGVSDLRSDVQLIAKESYLAPFITDMFEVVGMLWQMLGGMDEVDKILLSIDAYNTVLQHCDENLSMETIEIIFSTLKSEKKTIQRVMKEYKHEDH